jgi:hypothetical protein
MSTISLSICLISLSVKVDGKEEDYAYIEMEYIFAVVSSESSACICMLTGGV